MLRYTNEHAFLRSGYTGLLCCHRTDEHGNPKLLDALPHEVNPPPAVKSFKHRSLLLPKPSPTTHSPFLCVANTTNQSSTKSHHSSGGGTACLPCPCFPSRVQGRPCSFCLPRKTHPTVPHRKKAGSARRRRQSGSQLCVRVRVRLPDWSWPNHRLLYP